MFFKALITIRLLVYLSCFQTVEGAAPLFTVPVTNTSPGSVDENSQAGVSILTLEGTDTDGDTLTFSLVSQTPSSPPFSLDSITGVLTTPTGLDAEFSLIYNFIFGVSDAVTTVESVVFTLNINDINDVTPVFQGTPYSASLLNSVSNGHQVIVVNAIDGDVTSSITYSIISGNSPVTFSLDSNSGEITVSDRNQLNPSSTPTYSLVIQASDGTNSVTVTVSITVVVDYCYPADPCQNGTCVTMDTEYFCNCTTGFLGQNCSQVDYCYLADPCQNGTCVSMDTEYFCNCTTGYLGQNCSQVDQCYNNNPCENGGTCVTSVTSYTCTCASDYSGTNCTTTNASEPDKNTTDGSDNDLIIGLSVGLTSAAGVGVGIGVFLKKKRDLAKIRAINPKQNQTV